MTLIKQKSKKYETLTKLVTITILVYLGMAASQVVNWARLSLVKSGQLKLRLATTIGPLSINYTQPFFLTFNQTPQVAIGLMIMDFEPSSVRQGFSVNIHSISKTQFICELNVFSGTTVNELRYMYFGMIPSANLGVIYSIDQVFSVLNTNTAIGGQESIDHSSGNTYNLSRINLFVPFIKSWTITPQNGQYSVKVNTAIVNTTAYKITYQSNSTLNAVSVFVIWVDKTAVQKDRKQYADYGYSFAQNNQQGASSFQPPTSSYDFFAFIQGANWVNVNTNTRFQANLSPLPPLAMTSFSTYNYLSKQMLHFRFRNCVSFQLYLQQEQRCYDACPAGYATQNTFKFCLKCHYSCASCQTDGVTCLTCPTSVNRTQSGISCPCNRGLFDRGVAQCATCDYTCVTCVANSKNCQSCQSTRILTNNTCPCSIGKFDTLTNSSVCGSCHYTCLTCKNSSNICTSCNQANHNRILTQYKTCLCKSGFSDDGSGSNAVCQQNPALICSVLCQTCSSTSLSCTSCKDSQNRQLSANKTCICKVGFGGLGNTCLQICGDGIIINAECDDNNTLDGDGCSSSCLVQNGFTCNNTSAPSICLSNAGYNITYLNATKNLNSNSVTMSFLVLPQPPVSSVPKISNILYQNLTHTLNGSNLQISLSYLQEISPNRTLILIINQARAALQFKVESSNKVLIRAYEPIYYTIFGVENLMVYVLIGLAWFVFVVQIIISKQSLVSSLEMMISLSMVWIGVMGKSSLVLLFHPITFMYYIFTYNIIIDTGCVLGIVNIGFWMNLVTPILFLIVLIISKFTQKIGNQSQKNFFLYDLFYAALCFNGVIVTYGLARQIIDLNLNTLSIISIPFGAIYLIFVALISVLMILRYRRFPGMTSQIIKTSHFAVYLGIRYASVFVYIALTNLITLNSLFVIGSSVIMLGLVAFRKPYYENIRPMINELFILLVFSAYLIISQVSVAEWTGFMIITISLIFVLANAIMIFLQSRKRSKILDQSRSQDGIDQKDQKQKNISQDKGYQQSERRVNKKIVSEIAKPLQMQNFQMLKDNSGIKQPLFGQAKANPKRNAFETPKVSERFYQTNDKVNSRSSPKRNQELLFFGNPMHQQMQIK